MASSEFAIDYIGERQEMRIQYDRSGILSDAAVRLSVVFDNVPFHPHLKALWGFACFVELEGQALLFDTGSNGRVLLDNMARMGLDPVRVRTLFLSHPHWDHIGGLDSVIEVAPHLEIVAPGSLSRLLVEDLRGAVDRVTVIDENPARIADNLHTTGVMGEIGEQSLVIDTAQGLIVLTGCAHPGIDRIAARVQEMLNRDVVLLMGGFHLANSDCDTIDGVIDSLAALGVRALCPTHCTGELARERCAARFGADCYAGGVGRIVALA